MRGRGVGERIRSRRLELEVSQRQISAPGVSYAYISRIEAGERQPSVKALRQLAARLEVSVQWLETGENDFAIALAELVLADEGRPNRARAIALARKTLRQRHRS